MFSKLKVAAIAVSVFGVTLFLSLQTHLVGASTRHLLLNGGIGDIFQPIYGLFNGLFQGALPLVFLFFVIGIVLAIFSSPLWLKKIFGATK